jgi:glycosyl transferase family 25
VTIPIFVINLDRSPGRLEKIGRRLNSLGQPFLRVAAIDGRSLSSVEISRVRGSSRKLTPLSDCEVGCFLSHRKCWEIVAQGHHKYGCILEDDMVLSDSFPEAIQFADRLPGDLDILKLDTTFQRIWVDRKTFHLGSLRGVRLRSGHYGAGAYTISKRVAQKLLERTDTFVLGVDVFIYNPVSGIADELNIYQCMPAVCGHNGFLYPDREQETTIGQCRHCVIENKLSRKVRRLSEETRKIFHRLVRRKRVSVPLA